jgi:hypothetical protein
LTLEQEGSRGRIGYANDYFTAGEHPLAPGNDFVPNTDDYKQITEEVKVNNFYMSGEIPYNEDTEWGLAELISPIKSLRILREHLYPFPTHDIQIIVLRHIKCRVTVFAQNTQ